MENKNNESESENRKCTAKSSKIKQDTKNASSLVASDNEKYSQENQTQGVSATSVKIKPVQNKPKQQKSNKESKKTKTNEIFHYQKRTGTSGLSGQLYETKLLTLILFRALYVLETKTFLIATNVESMGAFDDIVLRFNSNKGDKPKIMFVQAKHRDNPKKDRFTVEEIMKLNGDFSLHKYLESYIKISQMFDPDNKDDMFKGEFKNMDCEFIIYTSAFENFSKMKAAEETECKLFINTRKGKVFRFDYDNSDVKLLVQTVAKSRAALLAKRLCRFIFKDNYSNMMMDDLIKTYHVFLARHVLEVELNKNGESQNNFLYAKFRKSFFLSNDNLLSVLKATISKEVLLQKKNISPEKPEELESFLMSLNFKVPVSFGNLNFSFGGTEQKREQKLEYLCSIFKKLLTSANKALHIVMKVDDSMVGPNEILKSTDLETYRLGGLVGNLLIFDDNTKTLKFNFDADTLSEDNWKLLKRLKTDVFEGIDISKCRFDINVHRFPRLSLFHDEYDKNLIEDFLAKLIFYTNQATEDEVEEILKTEINRYFVASVPRQRDSLFRIKDDAIFLKVHDRVQKWWQQPNDAPYLTETCKYFLQAEQDILNSPLLNILNFTYTQTVKNVLPELKFEKASLELLHLDEILKGTVKIMCIITEENALSSIKIIQYYIGRNFHDYTFIDLDYVEIGNYFVDVKSEIKESTINTVILVCKNKNVIPEINLIIKHFKGKIIIITNRDLSKQIKSLVPDDIAEIVDCQTGFKDVEEDMRLMLLQKRYVEFQGKEVPLGILFKDESYDLINSSVLYNIINNEKITVGNGFNNPAYDEILNLGCYINEQLCRYITFDSDIQAIDELNILKYNELGKKNTPDKRDIVLIADKQEEFEDFINKYECNVHWFSSDGDNCFVWQKSQGNLLNIVKHIQRGAHKAHTLQPMTLKDLKEKVIIVSAEPGMGKSSLLTHLAINTKQEFPELWITKINLLEHTKELKRIKDCKVSIDLKEAVKFLFRVIAFEANKEKKDNFELIINNHISVTGDDITINKNESELNLTGLKLFEVEYFIHCFNNSRVVLLFDGFDEICPDFANEFMQLVNIFKKSKVVYLWITSRLYNVLHQLESTLETFSYTIQPLSYDNQLEFLEKIWLSKGTNIMLRYFPFNTKWGLQDVVQGFLKVLSAVLCDTNNKFISIPLHLYMISEIFQDTFHDFPMKIEVRDSSRSQNTMNKINLNQIYERFVDIKFFKIRFGEKKPLLCINDPDMRKLIDNERTAFYYRHKLIAAHTIFGTTDEIKLFDNSDINKIHEFVEQINAGEEKTGIIEQIIDNKPKFVHYTFAEYFATEFLCDQLKSFRNKTSLWMYFINTFLQSEAGGPRRFFNAKLGNHQLMFNEIHNVEINELFENLLMQQQTLTKLIFKAIDEYLENSAVFLLRCMRTVVNKKNLDNFINIVSKNSIESCTVCIAVERKANEFVSFIISLIKEIDANKLIDMFKCSDLPKYNAVTVACGAKNDLNKSYKLLQPNFELNFAMLHTLLSYLPSPVIAEIFCIQFDYKWFNRIKSKKLIHLVASSLGDINFISFDKALEKLDKEQLFTIFSIEDSEKKLAAHRAAYDQSYTFFDKLDCLLYRSQFTKICMARDGQGLTPLHYFEDTEKDHEKLNTLIDKVYEDNTSEKSTLRNSINKNNKRKMGIAGIMTGNLFNLQ